MPSFRKLNPTDAKPTTTLSPRAQVAQAYDALLEEFAAGDYGEAALLAGEQRRTVRQRLQAAGSRRGLTLRFRPGPLPALIFQVEPAPALAQPVQPTPPPASPTPRRARGQSKASGRYDEVLPRWMREGGKGRRGR